MTDWLSAQCSVRPPFVHETGRFAEHSNLVVVQSMLTGGPGRKKSAMDVPGVLFSFTEGDHHP